jgi:1-acyl-sn-glycerol-3-phosphate acyltransferase
MEQRSIRQARADGALLGRPARGRPVGGELGRRQPQGAGRADDPGAATPGPLTETAAHLNGFRERSLRRGVNPFLYWTVRAIFVPFFLIYFRMRRIGREHLPRRGPLLLACNHRSFLDPFVIGTLTRRPVYYMAKRELFEHRLVAWLLNGLGAFPVDRGAGDSEAMETARAILARGDCVVLFPEGTRVRRGPPGVPRRGVGRLALQTGAPVAPVAVIGTDEVRRGWRIRPRKVCLRVGAPLLFPTAADPTPALAAGVTERVWACVRLQWDWLAGAGSWRDGRPRPYRTPARRRRAHPQSSARGELAEPSLPEEARAA